MKILKIEILDHKKNFVAAKATVDVSAATKAELKEVCDKVNDYLEREWVQEDSESEIKSELIVYIRGPRNKLVDITDG